MNNQHNIDTIRRFIRQSANRLWIVLVIGLCTSFVSCDNDDDSFPVYPINRPNAIVTVKPVAGCDSFFMQLDDTTTINAVNMRSKPYGNKEVRAFVSFRVLEQRPSGRNVDVYVNWMDSILTKPMSENLGDETNASHYGNDPVEILRDWTVAEDGYLTIHFRTQWANNGTPHIVSLVASNNTDPYELTFCHNAQGVKGGFWGDGIVAFRLDRLPDTKGKTVTAKLRWTSFGGERCVVFQYNSHSGASKIEGLSFAASGQFEKTIK